MSPTVVAAATGLGVALLATPLVRALARRTGWVAKPNPIVPQHVAPTALLGGLAIAVGCGAGLAALGPAEFAREKLALGTAAGFLVLGLLDDRAALSARAKFAFQALAALLAVLAGAHGRFSGIAAVDGAISWFWILLLVNAFNFLDVCDGLLAGVTVVYFGYAAFASPAHAPLAAAAAGATAGFLAYNRPRASIFLGDAGSHLLGSLAAVISLTPVIAPGGFSGLTLQMVALGIPLFECLFITSLRVHRGVPWWRGSPDHIALRLQVLGWSRWRTVLFAWGCALALAAGAIALARVAAPWAWVIEAVGFLGAVAFAAWLLARGRASAV